MLIIIIIIILVIIIIIIIIYFYCFYCIINIFLSEPGWSAWENLDLGCVYTDLTASGLVYLWPWSRFSHTDH